MMVLDFRVPQFSLGICSSKQCRVNAVTLHVPSKFILAFHLGRGTAPKPMRKSKDRRIVCHVPCMLTVCLLWLSSNCPWFQFLSWSFGVWFVIWQTHEVPYFIFGKVRVDELGCTYVTAPFYVSLTPDKYTRLPLTGDTSPPYGR